MNIPIKILSRQMKYLRLLRHIIVKKPLVIARIMVNYFCLFILRRKIVRKVEIGVTFDCQCTCTKCSSFFMKNPQALKLSLPEIERLAKEIISLGAIQINLTGGEPLLAENILEIIKHIMPNKVIITINTNGLLLSEEMIDKLETAGVDIIKISIDSPVPEEHDESRGVKGCFAQALKALVYIKKKKKMLAQISTVCIKENLNSFRIWKLVEMAKNYDALLGLTIPAVSGKWLNNEKILLDDKEKGLLNKLIKMPQVIRDTDESYGQSKCPAGSEEFYITCYGDVIPCPLIQISFGNVKETSLREIWRGMHNFEKFKNNKSGCLAGENKEFINNYIKPIRKYNLFPVNIEKHPLYQREDIKGKKGP